MLISLVETTAFTSHRHSVVCSVYPVYCLRLTKLVAVCASPLCQSIGRLVSQPLVDFSKLTGKDSYLTTHLTRNYHEDAVAKMGALKQSVSSGDIAVKVSTQYAQQVERNRAILHALISEIPGWQFNGTWIYQCLNR